MKKGLCWKFSIDQLIGKTVIMEDVFQIFSIPKNCLPSEVCPFLKPLDIRVIFSKPETCEIQLSKLDYLIFPRKFFLPPGGTVQDI